MKPILVITDDIPPEFGGRFISYLPWRIEVRPKYQNDLGLIAHETEHWKQFWKSFGLFALLYPLYTPYRLWAEVQAYRVQLATGNYPDGAAEQFAGFISTEYNLGISKVDALKLLTEL